jgi:cell wall-associated NlpC family hydrolase
LRYNHGDESLDVGPNSPLPRAEVAWSLYRAKTDESWTTDSLRSQYLKMELPNLGKAAKNIVQFGIDYVGYPYVWGGEWYQSSPSGYCCGAQPVGGFDCSGITWFVMRAASGTWDPTPPRTYRGWSLPQRSSSEMAGSGGKVRFKALEPGDLMFYDGDGNGVVDHVDVFIGNGFSLDSSSGYAGVSIVYTAEGWYRDHFVHGRRIIG